MSIGDFDPFQQWSDAHGYYRAAAGCVPNCQYFRPPNYQGMWPGYYAAPQQGCICPPRAEKTCQGPLCPRRAVVDMGQAR